MRRRVRTYWRVNGIENSFHDETEAATLQETPPKGTRKAPGALDPAVVLPPPPGMQHMLRSLKIKALACVAKDTISICLAERKPEVWGK